MPNLRKKRAHNKYHYSQISEKIKEASRASYNASLEKKRAASRASYKADPGKRKAASRACYNASPEENKSTHYSPSTISNTVKHTEMANYAANTLPSTSLRNAYS